MDVPRAVYHRQLLADVDTGAAGSWMVIQSSNGLTNRNMRLSASDYWIRYQLVGCIPRVSTISGWFTRANLYFV